jgi:hypothetical protein
MSTGLDFVESNLHYLAGRADGQFIDLSVRPKSARKTWTKESYTEEVLENIGFWRAQSVEEQMRGLNGLKGFTLGALEDQFQLWRDIAMILRRRPIDRSVPEVAKRELEERRTTEKHKDQFDRSKVCIQSGLAVFIRDINNNYIDKKAGADREVCPCKTCERNRTAMTKAIAEKRKRPKRKKKDPERYK